MSALEGVAPLNLYRLPIDITASDCQLGFRVTIPAVLQWLQEAAGRHAEALGVGIQSLQAQGLTWMLGRMTLRLIRMPLWGEAITLNTWPSGIRGRLVAERQFFLETAAGERLIEASSEWLCVNLATGKLAPLPEAVKTLAAPETVAFGLCAAKFPTPPTADQPLNTLSLTARKAEIDANHHVNNVHLAAYLREPLPETLFFEQTPDTFDIEYKRPVVAGDEITTSVWTLSENTYLHHLQNREGALIARAHSHYPQH